MMSRRQPFALNSASMVSLKAELYRKKLEAQQPRPGPASGPTRKTPAWLRPDKPARPAKRQRAAPEPDEDAALLAKSRETLEAKSRLYAELSASARPCPDPDDDDGFLVDFERKQEEGEGRREEREEEEEEWVEYTDVFGRSRKCLREDLPAHLTRNDALRDSLNSKDDKKEEEEEEEEEEVEEEKPQRQEKEERREDSPPPAKLRLHYADVQANEVRSHGVGFFPFSAHEAERRSQMAALNQQRQDTLTARERAERVKAKRQAAMEERLSRVKARRGMESRPEHEKTEEKEESQEAAIAATLAMLRAQTEESREKHARNNPFTPRREWDRGKAMMTGEKYLEERRNVRQAEFAPTYTRR